MTFAILTYEVEKGKSTSLKVRPQQCLFIGASNSADIQLVNSKGLAPRHCEVKFEQGTFKIADLTVGKDTVSVNGTPVKNCKLEHGDCIEIGENKLTVVLQPQTSENDSSGVLSQPANSLSSPVTDGNVAALDSGDLVVANPDQWEPEFVDNGNGVQTFALIDFQSDIHPRFKAANDRWRYGVFFNHKVSGFDEPPPPDGNLLSDQTAEIERKNDLYFETSDDMNAILAKFSRYAESQSAVLTVLKHDAKVDEAELKQLATWFMSPEKVKFNLVNGTELLISKVFDLFDFLVVPEEGVRRHLLLLNDSAVVDWPSFISRIKEHTDDVGS